MEDAIGWRAQTILYTLSTAEMQSWIRREGLGHDIELLESEVEMVDMVYAAVGERATGNKPLGRSLAFLKDLLYDADDLVDDLDFCRLLESSPAATGSSVIGRNDTPIRSTSSNLFVGSLFTDSSGIQELWASRTGQCSFSYGTYYALRELKDIFGSVQVHEKLSSVDVTEDAEEFAIGDSCSRKKRRMDDESTHGTKAKTHLCNKLECPHRIQEITRLLQAISGVLSKVLKLHGTDFVASSDDYRSSTPDQHLQTSSVAPRKVYGRVTEKDYIIKSMTEYKPYGSVHVLPIVGSAGVGKTTLAQFIFNDGTVAEHFHQRIWISVSNNFDEVRISRQILDCVSQETHEGLCSFSKLQEVLKMHITSKRILLIFDDVWDDINICRWSQLLAPLQSNTKGPSGIICRLPGEKTQVIYRAMTSIRMWSSLQHVDVLTHMVFGCNWLATMVQVLFNQFGW